VTSTNSGKAGAVVTFAAIKEAAQSDRTSEVSTTLGACVYNKYTKLLILKPNNNKCIFNLNATPTYKKDGADTSIYPNISDITHLEIQGDSANKTITICEITNSSGTAIVLNLPKGFEIDGNAKITSFKLDNEKAIVNADIENKGTIINGGVVIGESSKTAFPLRPGTSTSNGQANANKTAKFTNLKSIAGGFTITGVATKTSVAGNNVNTFELVNNSSNASITGNITLETDSPNALKFKLTNTQGTIKSDNITVTEIDNSGTIQETKTSATIKAGTITNNANIGKDSNNLTITAKTIKNKAGTIKAKFAIPS
ncbi:Hypothetical predicted protein, partial [Paramuricea clavata]